jgi:hypothetical protein
MRELDFNDAFDAAVVWQGSFGYFSDKDNIDTCNGPQKLDRAISLCITCFCPKGVTHETKEVRRELQGAHSS